MCFNCSHDFFSGEDKTIEEIINEILPRDKYTHEYLWKQKIYSMKEFQLKTVMDLLPIEPKNKLDESIYIEILKVLLINWDGLSAYDCEVENSSEIVYKELLAYLNKNIITLRRIVLTKLTRNEQAELYETEFDESEFDECIVVECPLKKLKTLFCSKIDIEKGMIYDITYEDVYKSDFNYFPQNFSNWPHTAVKFSIKGFEILHQNYNHYEYNVINLDSTYKPEIEHATNTALHFLPNECDKYVRSPSIIQYIHNLRTKISHKSCEIPPGKKIEMITFLNEITRDFRHASEDVGLGVSYFMNLCPYPYVLCTSNSKVPDQPRGCKNNKLISIRLQQIVYPAVKFCVSKFPSTTEDTQFLTIEDLMNSLKYYCTVCKSRFETTVFSEFMQHAITVHGFENGHYCCVRCDKYFPVKILSANRWTHTCMPNLSKD